METAAAARAGRRKRSLRQLAPGKGRRGNQTFDAAYESFYRRHVTEVYQYALAVLGNPADAEDVTQQTFLNAYRAFQRGERPRKPHNWLIKIAHNVCRMRWRQASRRPQEVPLEHAREPAALDDDKPSLDEVLTALVRLPFNQRAAIVMREVEDRSYAEIADVLDTTVPAVEALLFRARTNLRARRKALAGTLSIAPLPASLSSFFGGGGGGLVAAGGAVAGSELVLKIAAVVATGVVAGGLGFKSVKALATSDPATKQLSPSQYEARGSSPNPALSLSHPAGQRARVGTFRHPRRGIAAQRTLRGAPTNDRPSEKSLAPSHLGPVVSAPSSASTDTVKGVVASVPEAATTASPVPIALPSVPLAPPSVPLAPPSVPLAPPAVPSVTVTVPPISLPPVLK
jgi:RNA polymerase sigma-70 factor (ECF subfamily)